jgi:uncharacterized protein involved in exopolysaccharide biosynthesis
VGLALAYVMLAPKVYESTAVIYVDPKNEGRRSSRGSKGVRQASWESLDALKSMAEGIRNGTVILRVAEKLKLREDADFLPLEGGRIRRCRARGSDRQAGEGRSPPRHPAHRCLGARSHSPERARAMTAAFIDEFQNLIREQNVASAEKSRGTLEQEAANQLVRVHQAEETLQDFRKQHAEVALDENRDLTSTKLEDLDKLLSGAANDVLLKKAEFEQYKAIPPAEIERVFEIGDFRQPGSRAEADPLAQSEAGRIFADQGPI